MNRMKVSVGLLLTTGMLALAACVPSNNQVEETPGNQCLGQALEGTYVVSTEDTVLGHLRLTGDRYTFTRRWGVRIPEAIVDRLPFTEYQEGSYNLDYYRPIGHETLLEDLKGSRSDMLASISLTADGHDEPDSYYVVFSDSESELFFFASVVPELVPTWGVSKPWD